MALEPSFDHLPGVGIDGTEDPRKGLEGKFSLEGGFDPEATPAVIGQRQFPKLFCRYLFFGHGLVPVIH